MHSIITNKILELRDSGLTDWRAIQDALRKPAVIEQAVTVSRPSADAEQALAVLVFKYVAPQELMATDPAERKTLIASKMQAAVASAEGQAAVNAALADSLLMLTLDSQVTTSFSSPDFGQPETTVMQMVAGASWLVANGLTDADIPAKYDILKLIET